MHEYVVSKRYINGGYVDSFKLAEKLFILGNCVFFEEIVRYPARLDALGSQSYKARRFVLKTSVNIRRCPPTAPEALDVKVEIKSLARAMSDQKMVAMVGADPFVVFAKREEIKIEWPSHGCVDNAEALIKGLEFLESIWGLRCVETHDLGPKRHATVVADLVAYEHHSHFLKNLWDNK